MKRGKGNGGQGTSTGNEKRKKLNKELDTKLPVGLGFKLAFVSKFSFFLFQDQGISWFNSNKRTLTEINSKKPYEYQRLLKRLEIKKNCPNSTSLKDVRLSRSQRIVGISLRKH